jgi:hypothetical protein
MTASSYTSTAIIQGFTAFKMMQAVVFTAFALSASASIPAKIL